MRKLSKEQRLNKLLSNINKGKTEEDIESELSFQIWFVEKEFGFLITDDFPALKFANMVKAKHIKRYNDLMKSQTSGTGEKGLVKTFR